MFPYQQLKGLVSTAWFNRFLLFCLNSSFSNEEESPCRAGLSVVSVRSQALRDLRGRDSGLFGAAREALLRGFWGYPVVP